MAGWRPAWSPSPPESPAPPVPRRLSRVAQILAAASPACACTPHTLVPRPPTSPSSPEPAATFYEGFPNTTCPPTDVIKSRDDCSAAHAALGLANSQSWAGPGGDVPAGCSTGAGGEGMHWNPGAEGKPHPKLTPPTPACTRCDPTQHDL
eukprot:gene4385-4645_t